MGKNKKHDNEKRRDNGRMNDDVKAFIKMSPKKFKKENKSTIYWDWSLGTPYTD